MPQLVSNEMGSFGLGSSLGDPQWTYETTLAHDALPILGFFQKKSNYLNVIANTLFKILSLAEVDDKFARFLCSLPPLNFTQGSFLQFIPPFLNKYN